MGNGTTGRENADDSIYALYAKVGSHPDFAGGTIFTRDDVASALSDSDHDDKKTEGSPDTLAPRRRHKRATRGVTGFVRSFLFDFVFVLTNRREEIRTWLGGEPPPA